MSISVKPLGAGQEVGRSCVIVKIKDIKIMFDCGVHMAFHDNRKFPDFKRIVNNYSSTSNVTMNNIMNDSNTFNPMIPQQVNIYQNLDNKIDYTKHIDLVIITHFHLDHCGALPYFTEICGYDGPIITSQPTKAILPLTLEDFRRIISDFRGEKSIITPDQITKCVSKVQTIEIGEEKIINKRIIVTSYYAGHVLGAGMYRVEVDGFSVIYTGDYNTASDRHLSGAYLPKLSPNILITETTYGDTIRDTKRAREREFLKKIQSTIDKGGKVLIPIFALGRAQELCILLDTHWRRTKCEVPIYFAGPMAEKANFYYKIFTNWTNSKIQNTFLERNVFEFSFVKHGDKSVTKSNQPMVIFATPGMLHGGLSMSIFKELAPDSRNCVIIPGYCTAGTLGNKILSGEKLIEIDKQMIEVKCDVYYMSFSAHADAKGLLQLIKNAAPKNVVLVHGDSEVMKKFQKSVEISLSINTVMPANLEEVYLDIYKFYYQLDMSPNLFQKLFFLIERKIKMDNNFTTLSGDYIPKLKIIDSKNSRYKLEYVNPLFLNNQNKCQNIVIKNNLQFILKNSLLDFKIIFEEFLKKFYSAQKKTMDTLISDDFMNIVMIENKIQIKWSYCNKNMDQIRKHKRCYEISKLIECFVKTINISN